MAFLNARKAKTGAGVSGMFFVESSKDPVYAVRNRSHNTQVVIIGFVQTYRQSLYIGPFRIPCQRATRAFSSIQPTPARSMP